MSSLVTDLLEKAVKRVGRLPTPPWDKKIAGDEWNRVGQTILKIMEEAKGHGLEKPLGPLQEAAFFAALQSSADKATQTIALWLTDTRIVVESYGITKSPDLRARLVNRGLLREHG